ncbi:hypothetical protein EDD16DRAFT_857001 [Pisolithus croceorrhizus]|nr:hypothetical protein EV401DRAFT_557832 [Pisolithus croceorrhizus]KAI6131435.1 hypothetical protein EDD16DRAFT_857001 [Pisolithus croceorrhizus]KAI6156384.1 hypothetical protein EDD17DRAFT_1044022 [Pisolithus thermaeus]
MYFAVWLLTASYTRAETASSPNSKSSEENQVTLESAEESPLDCIELLQAFSSDTSLYKILAETPHIVVSLSPSQEIVLFARTGRRRDQCRTAYNARLDTLAWWPSYKHELVKMSGCVSGRLSRSELLAQPSLMVHRAVAFFKVFKATISEESGSRSMGVQ